MLLEGISVCQNIRVKKMESSQSHESNLIRLLNAAFKVIAELSEVEPDSMEERRLILQRDNILYEFDRLGRQP